MKILSIYFIAISFFHNKPALNRIKKDMFFTAVKFRKECQIKSEIFIERKTINGLSKNQIESFKCWFQNNVLITILPGLFKNTFKNT